jgi:hypothetical protein
VSNTTVSYTAILKDLVSGPLGQMGQTGQKAFQRMDAAQGQVQSGTKGLASAFNGLKQAFLPLLAISGVMEIGRAVIDTTGKFQTLQAVLSNTLGSESAAQQLFQDIQNFASKTPYQVDELTESAVKLANRGIVPTMGEMTKMGDLAATLGKPFGDLNEAMLDVSNTERWTELGIKVTKNGNQMTGTFRGVTKTVAATEAGAMEMVNAFGGMEGVSGTMEKISGTLSGKLSNLQDKFTTLAGEVGNALMPVIDFTADLFGGLATKMSEAIGFIQANASVIAQVFAPIREAIQPVIEAFMRTREQMGLTQDTGTLLAGVFNFIGNVLEFVKPVLVAIGNGFNFMNEKVWQVINSFQHFYKESETLQAVVQGIGRFIIAVFQKAIHVVTNLFGGLADMITGLLEWDADKIKSGIGSLGEAVFGGPDPLKEALTGKDFQAKDFFSGGIAKKDNAVAGGPESLADARNRLNNQMGGPKPPGAGGGSAGSGSGTGVSGIEGATRTQSIVVNIQKVVGIENLVTQHMAAATERLREEVTQILLTAINDVTITANG